MVKDYTIGIYIRLSMADEDTGNGSKAESDSIGNQRMLINRYLDNHPTLSKYPRLEFADDGYMATCGTKSGNIGLWTKKPPKWYAVSFP